MRPTMTRSLRATFAAVVASVVCVHAAPAVTRCTTTPGLTQCTDCEAAFSTNPASGDTGLVASCQGFVELRLTIIPYEGHCARQGDGCIPTHSCSFDITLDYRARSCSMALTQNNPCDGPPHLEGTYPPTGNNWGTVVSHASSSQACGTQCSLSYQAKCLNCSTGGVSISLDMGCEMCVPF